MRFGFATCPSGLAFGQAASVVSAHRYSYLAYFPVLLLPRARLRVRSYLALGWVQRDGGHGDGLTAITFLGDAYYSWTRLAPVTVGGWHWLQTVVLINPLIYVNEGMRAALTSAPHMHLYVIYPVVAGFGAAFLAIGLRNFRRRVLS